MTKLGANWKWIMVEVQGCLLTMDQTNDEQKNKKLRTIMD